MRTMIEYNQNYDGTPYLRYLNEYGNPISRTPETHPYSYDGFVTHRNGDNSEVNDTIYCDRMWQQNYKLYDDLCEKHFGNKSQVFYDRSPKQIEAFLRDWYNLPKLKLILIMEYCNVSNGYPVWRFDVNTNRNS